ncbi:cucurbitadienol 11-hydroxylase-like [Eucalyptus grandis]|uniref:cucurbitadienol 11-hydroxylase-like n=1 Tax=Eucalyptus grandis TaxID=71139 RepID=UPI00192ED341|nr:cucurbitadienol 11-hydroxylase-like [Eucalyptus grandis]
MWFVPNLEIVMGLMALIAIAVSHWKYKWRIRSSGGKLPPGSMGFPLIGETIEFFMPSKSVDIPPFLKKRTKRYGTLFKTNVVGRPAVISADPDFNRFILLEEGKSVEMWYLDAFAKLLGHDTTTDLEVKTNVTGYIHKHVTNVILNHFGPERLKDKLLPQLQAMAEKTLNAWSTREFVDVKRDCAMMIFNLTSELLFSYDAERTGENLTGDISRLYQGLMSLPINIPGTTFHESLKSQKKLLNIIEREITERIASPGIRKRDLLDHLLEDMKTQTFLTRDFITYLMVALMVASLETVSTGLTMTIKLITESPRAVQELIVINESFRLASISPGIVRRTLKDIHWNGYIIPKDWTIIMVQTGLHLNPEAFVDPLHFNPSRWKQQDIEKVRANYYIPFGGVGGHALELNLPKLCMLYFSKFWWVKVKGGEVARTPMLDFGGGFHIKVSKIQE